MRCVASSTGCTAAAVVWLTVVPFAADAFLGNALKRLAPATTSTSTTTSTTAATLQTPSSFATRNDTRSNNNHEEGNGVRVRLVKNPFGVMRDDNDGRDEYDDPQSKSYSQSNTCTADLLREILDEAVVFYTTLRPSGTQTTQFYTNQDLPLIEQVLQDTQTLIQQVSYNMITITNTNSNTVTRNGKRKDPDLLQGTSDMSLVSTSSASIPQQQPSLLEGSKTTPKQDVAKQLDEALQRYMRAVDLGPSFQWLAKQEQATMEQLAQEFRTTTDTEEKNGKSSTSTPAGALHSSGELSFLMMMDAVDFDDATTDMITSVEAFRERLHKLKAKVAHIMPQEEDAGAQDDTVAEAAVAEEPPGFGQRVANGVRDFFSNSNGKEEPEEEEATDPFDSLDAEPRSTTPDPEVLQDLLDQAEEVLEMATMEETVLETVHTELEELMKEIQSILDDPRAAMQEQEPERPSDSGADSPSPQLRTKQLVAKELEAALQLHMKLGDEASRELVEELAAEYKVVPEGVVVATGEENDETDEENELPHTSTEPSISAVANLIHSLQARIDDVAERVEEQLTNMEAAATTTDSKTETTVQAENDEEEDDDIFIDAVILEEQIRARDPSPQDDSDDDINIAKNDPRDVISDQKTQAQQWAQQYQKEKQARSKDRVNAIDAAILPDAPLAVPFMNGFLEGFKGLGQFNGKGEKEKSTTTATEASSTVEEPETKPVAEEPVLEAPTPDAVEETPVLELSEEDDMAVADPPTLETPTEDILEAPTPDAVEEETPVLELSEEDQDDEIAVEESPTLETPSEDTATVLEAPTPDVTEEETPVLELSEEDSEEAAPVLELSEEGDNISIDEPPTLETPVEDEASFDEPVQVAADDTDAEPDDGDQQLALDDAVLEELGTELNTASEPAVEEIDLDDVDILQDLSSFAEAAPVGTNVVDELQRLDDDLADINLFQDVAAKVEEKVDVVEDGKLDLGSDPAEAIAEDLVAELEAANLPIEASDLTTNDIVDTTPDLSAEALAVEEVDSTDPVVSKLDVATDAVVSRETVETDDVLLSDLVSAVSKVDDPSAANVEYPEEEVFPPTRESPSDDETVAAAEAIMSTPTELDLGTENVEEDSRTEAPVVEGSDTVTTGALASSDVAQEVLAALKEAESAIEFANRHGSPVDREAVKTRRQKVIHKMAGMAFDATVKGALGLANGLASIAREVRTHKTSKNVPYDTPLPSPSLVESTPRAKPQPTKSDPLFFARKSPSDVAGKEATGGQSVQPDLPFSASTFGKPLSELEDDEDDSSTFPPSGPTNSSLGSSPPRTSRLYLSRGSQEAIPRNTSNDTFIAEAFEDDSNEAGPTSKKTEAVSQVNSILEELTRLSEQSSSPEDAALILEALDAADSKESALAKVAAILDDINSRSKKKNKKSARKNKRAERASAKREATKKSRRQKDKDKPAKKDPKLKVDAPADIAGAKAAPVPTSPTPANSSVMMLDLMQDQLLGAVANNTSTTSAKSDDLPKGSTFDAKAKKVESPEKSVTPVEEVVAKQEPEPEMPSKENVVLPTAAVEDSSKDSTPAAATEAKSTLEEAAVVADPPAPKEAGVADPKDDSTSEEAFEPKQDAVVADATTEPAESTAIDLASSEEKEEPPKPKPFQQLKPIGPFVGSSASSAGVFGVRPDNMGSDAANPENYFGHNEDPSKPSDRFKQHMTKPSQIQGTVIGMAPDKYEVSADNMGVVTPVGKEISDSPKAQQEQQPPPDVDKLKSLQMTADNMGPAKPLEDIYKGQEQTKLTERYQKPKPVERPGSDSKLSLDAYQLTGDNQGLASPLEEIYKSKKATENFNDPQRPSDRYKKPQQTQQQQSPVVGVSPDSYQLGAQPLTGDSQDIASPLEDIYRHHKQIHEFKGTKTTAKSTATPNPNKAVPWMSPDMNRVQRAFPAPRNKTESLATAALPSSSPNATAANATSADKKKDDGDDDENQNPPKPPSGRRNMNKPISFFDMRQAWVEGGNANAFSTLSMTAKRSLQFWKQPADLEQVRDDQQKGKLVAAKKTFQPLRRVVDTVITRLRSRLWRKKAKPLSFSNGNGDDHDRRKQIMATSTTLYSQSYTHEGSSSVVLLKNDPQERIHVLQWSAMAVVYPLLLRWIRTNVVLAAVMLPHCWFLLTRRSRDP